MNGSGHVLESHFRGLLFGWKAVPFAEGKMGGVTDWGRDKEGGSRLLFQTWPSESTLRQLSGEAK